MNWRRGDRKLTALLDWPLFFVNHPDPELGKRSGFQLELRASSAWVAHICYSAIICGWPLVFPGFAQLAGSMWLLGLIVSSLYVVFFLALLFLGMRADVRMRRSRAISYQQRPPFERYQRALVGGWLPLLIVTAATASLSTAFLLIDKPTQTSSPPWIAFVIYLTIGVGLPFAVYMLARYLGLFRLPDLTEWYQALPPKIERMVHSATRKCQEPAESWRYLDGLSQVIRRLALHEVIFRGESDRSVLASATALMTWRLAAITYPLISLIAVPFLLSGLGYWDENLKIPLALAIFNWAAMALSYYVYASEQGVSQEQRRLKWRRHLSLCRALGLRPERVITPEIEPFFGASGVKSALFVFTVIVPMYLGLIDIIP